MSQPVQVRDGLVAYTVDEPSLLRPPRGWVLVRVEPDPEPERVAVPTLYGSTTHYGEVVSLGADVDAVRIGDRVVVESMSGHPAMTAPLICGETGQLLEIVPCSWPLPPIQTQDEQLSKRTTRNAALRLTLTRFYGKRERTWPFKAREELRILGSEIEALRQARAGHCRSRLLMPIFDLGVGQGILAVVENGP